MQSLRKLIEQNTGASAAVAGVVVLVAIVVIATRRSAPPGTYFYDTGSKSLYIAPAGTLPPAVAPSGAEGVVAIVLSCGDCADESGRFIGYLQTFTDAYRTALINGDEMKDKLLFEGQLVRSVEDETWYADGPQAAEIVRKARSRCEKNQFVACRPE